MSFIGAAFNELYRTSRPWPTWVFVCVWGSVVAFGAFAMWQSISEKNAKVMEWRAERKATYDRYMSQCLKEHQEYECASLLWKYRP